METSYKEKYEQALSVARETYQSQPMYREWLEKMFPELKESEDEKVRKTLIRFFKDSYHNETEMYGVTVGKALAWLEKQGEKKNRKASYTAIAETGNGGINALITRDIEIPFGAKDSELQKATYYIPKGYHVKIEGNKVVYEQKSQRMISAEAKEALFDYENADNQQKDFASGTVGYEEERLTPLEKKIKDYLFDFHVNATEGISFDGTMAIVRNLITLCQQEDKPAWSEEDETVLNNLIYALANDRIGNNRDEYVYWLKSLRPQNRWQPSDEQMEALNYVVNLMASSESPKENDYYYNVFKDLRKQLKKLMEG